MLPELRYELLFFHTRDDLERLQPLSQTLSDMIVAGSNVLPLRPIYCVNMDYYDAGVYNFDQIQIFVEKPVDSNELEPDYVASILCGDFKETYLRLQNTCVKEFNIGIHDSPFLRYWKAQQDATFTVVIINFFPAGNTDYDLLDSVMNHLRPRTTLYVEVDESSGHENGNKTKLLELLLSRHSFLINLQTCSLSVLDGPFPPPAFILNDPGYPTYELWCTNSNVADGIDSLIESFVRDGCANKRLESVWTTWEDHEGQQRPAPKQLRKPTKTDVPLPQNDMTAGLADEVYQVTQCEVNSFVNTKQWKQMDVYQWTIEYDADYGRVTTDIFQCRVKNL